MSNSRGNLILASASPRRRELLARARFDFEVRESAVVEKRRGGESAAQFALRMAEEKAAEVSARHPAALVIGADTVVECAGATLGKPENAAHAREMLRILSGRTHTVVTGFALASAGKIVESAAVPSRVTFRRISPDEIERYVASGEPLDKAGAYGIQGIGGSFIERVEGSRDNVMGLPLEEVLAALARHRDGRRAQSPSGADGAGG